MNIHQNKYIYIYKQLYIYKYTYVYIYIYTYIHIYTYINVYIYTHININIYSEIREGRGSPPRKRQSRWIHPRRPPPIGRGARSRRRQPRVPHECTARKKGMPDETENIGLTPKYVQCIHAYISVYMHIYIYLKLKIYIYISITATPASRASRMYRAKEGHA